MGPVFSVFSPKWDRSTVYRAKVTCLLKQSFFLCFYAFLINIDFRIIPYKEHKVFHTKVFLCAGVGYILLQLVAEH